MEKEYCVYMHTFPNGKRYIGVTCCQPNRRWQNGYGYVRQRRMYRAICKYGWDNIEHEIIADNLTAEQASKMESKLVNLYQTMDKDKGYNVQPGGVVGYHLSEEQKAKISQKNSGSGNGRYGYRYSDEERRYMSEHSVWRGRKHTEETRKKISEIAKAHPERLVTLGFKGKRHSEESRKKMSEAAKKRGYKGSRNKYVVQYDLDGRYINTFESIAEAGRQFNALAGNNINAVCRGKKKTAYGYIWRYADAN